MNRIRPLAALLVTLISGAAPLLAAGDPPQVAVVSPARRDLQDWYETTGTLAASRQVDLVARVAGSLQAAEVADGARVRAGQTLFVIEPDAYRAALEQARATEASARAQLTYAEAQLTRQRALKARAVIDQATLDEAQASRDEAAAALDSAAAGVTTATLQLGYATVSAPFDGVMGARSADPGAYVGASGAQTLATLYAIDPIRAEFTVPEADLSRLRRAAAAAGLPLPGTGPVRVLAGTDADAPDYPLAGSLSYVAPAATDGTGTFAMYATFANPEGALRPGMFVRLRLPLGPPAPHLMVPAASIGTDLAGRYVLAVKDGVLTRLAVTPGAGDGPDIAIDGAVDAADRIVANVAAAPPAGSRVTPVPAAGAS